MAERSSLSHDIGEALLHRGYRLFHWWLSPLGRFRQRVRDGTVSEAWFQAAVAQ